MRIDVVDILPVEDEFSCSGARSRSLILHVFNIPRNVHGLDALAVAMLRHFDVHVLELKLPSADDLNGFQGPCDESTLIPVQLTTATVSARYD